MTKPYTIMCRFLFQLVGMISLNRNYQEVINLLFGFPFALYLNILKTRKILQFWDKKFSRRAWHVIPAQKVNIFSKIYLFLLGRFFLVFWIINFAVPQIFHTIKSVS